MKISKSMGNNLDFRHFLGDSSRTVLSSLATAAQDTYKQRSGEDHEGDPPADARRRQLPRRLFGHDASRGQPAAHIRHEMGHAPVSLLQNGILVIQ